MRKSTSLTPDLGHIGIGEQQYAGSHRDQSIDDPAEKQLTPAGQWGAPVSTFQKLIDRRGIVLCFLLYFIQSLGCSFCCCMC